MFLFKAAGEIGNHLNQLLWGVQSSKAPCAAMRNNARCLAAESQGCGAAICDDRAASPLCKKMEKYCGKCYSMRGVL